MEGHFSYTKFYLCCAQWLFRVRHLWKIGSVDYKESTSPEFTKLTFPSIAGPSHRQIQENFNDHLLHSWSLSSSFSVSLAAFVLVLIGHIVRFSGDSISAKNWCAPSFLQCRLSVPLGENSRKTLNCFLCNSLIVPQFSTSYSIHLTTCLHWDSVKTIWLFLPTVSMSLSTSKRLFEYKDSSRNKVVVVTWSRINSTQVRYPKSRLYAIRTVPWSNTLVNYP